MSKSQNPSWPVSTTLVLLVACGLLACSVDDDAAQGEPVDVVPDGPKDSTWRLTEADFAQPWITLQVPRRTDESVQGLTRGPDGFLAVVYEDYSEGKVIKPGAYRLARSADGVSWDSTVFEPATLDHWYRVAHANGRIVIVGARASRRGVLRISTDGQRWDVHETNTPGLKEVAFVNGRFFALGSLGSLLVSDDGSTWEDRSQPTAQNNAVAFGNGRWVVAGNTHFFVSTDAESWKASSIECSDAATCPGATPPGWQPGDPVSIAVFKIFFARGKFYAGQYVSADGLAWDVMADPVPSAFEGDTFLRFAVNGVVRGSSDAKNWSLETTIVDDNPAGYTCADHPCFVAERPDIGRVILLVPRP